MRLALLLLLGTAAGASLTKANAQGDGSLVLPEKLLHAKQQLLQVQGTGTEICAFESEACTADALACAACMAQMDLETATDMCDVVLAMSSVDCGSIAFLNWTKCYMEELNTYCSFCDIDCDDADPCTIDACALPHAVCQHTIDETIPGCKQIEAGGANVCATESDSCTEDALECGVCLLQTNFGGSTDMCDVVRAMRNVECDNEAFNNWISCYVEALDPYCVFDDAGYGGGGAVCTSDCNDSNPCTVDICSPDGICEHVVDLGAPGCDIEAACLTSDDCAPHAVCLVDEDSKFSFCHCEGGFIGDGSTLCHAVQVLSEEERQAVLETTVFQTRINPEGEEEWEFSLDLLPGAWTSFVVPTPMSGIAPGSKPKLQIETFDDEFGKISVVVSDEGVLFEVSGQKWTLPNLDDADLVLKEPGDRDRRVLFILAAWKSAFNDFKDAWESGRDCLGDLLGGDLDHESCEACVQVIPSLLSGGCNLEETLKVVSLVLSAASSGTLAGPCLAVNKALAIMCPIWGVLQPIITFFAKFFLCGYCGDASIDQYEECDYDVLQPIFWHDMKSLAVETLQASVLSTLDFILGFYGEALPDTKDLINLKESPEKAVSLIAEIKELFSVTGKDIEGEVLQGILGLGFPSDDMQLGFTIGRGSALSAPVNCYECRIVGDLVCDDDIKACEGDEDCDCLPSEHAKFTSIEINALAAQGEWHPYCVREDEDDMLGTCAECYDDFGCLGELTCVDYACKAADHTESGGVDGSILMDSIFTAWKEPANWDGYDLKKFRGITLDDKGRITALDLGYSFKCMGWNCPIGIIVREKYPDGSTAPPVEREVTRIEVSLPESIGQLSELTNLYLASFEGWSHKEGDPIWYQVVITGKLPTSIGDLSHLTHLDLSGNELEGPVPVSWAKLASLEILDMSGNPNVIDNPGRLSNFDAVQDYLRSLS
jgi:hypothetical protein